jgi:two-component system OmpR family response regulator
MSRRRTVLLVDDEEAIRIIAELSLGRVGGFNVRLASNGQEALEEVARKRPDVVLLDVMMPKLDGPKTLAALRQTHPAEELPVVFLTAALQPEQVQSLMELDAQGLLGKPFEPMQLASDLSAILGWRAI